MLVNTLAYFETPSVMKKKQSKRKCLYSLIFVGKTRCLPYFKCLDYDVNEHSNLFCDIVGDREEKFYNVSTKV